MQSYRKIRQAKVKAARRKIRLKRQRWGKNVIIRNGRRRGVRHG